MRWQRQEGFENPAWPGLVDIFAFTLVLILMLSGNLWQENAELKDRAKDQEKQLVEMERQLAIILGKGKELLQGLEKCLRGARSEHLINLKYSEEARELEISFNPPISFPTGRYELSRTDQDRLQRLAPHLWSCTRDKPFIILINGTADPQPMDTKTPPRNNTELSALRAAAVSALLLEAVPEIGRLLRIVGLGVKGELIEPTPPDPDKAYEPYRTVTLVLRVDETALSAHLESQPR